LRVRLSSSFFLSSFSFLSLSFSCLVLFVLFSRLSLSCCLFRCVPSSSLSIVSRFPSLHVFSFPLLSRLFLFPLPSFLFFPSL
jgi:hypothetical protein